MLSTAAVAQFCAIAEDASMAKKSNPASKMNADKNAARNNDNTNGSKPTNDWAPADMGFLAPSTAPAPAFPLSEMPTTLGALIAGLADARQVPLDYVAGAILGACSGAIGNRARLRTYDGSSEPGILFVGLVGPSSSGKSAALKIAQQPLEQIDRDLETVHASLTWGTAQSAVAKFDQRLKESVARRLYLEGQPSVAGPTDASKPVPAPAILLSEYTGPGLLEELRHGLDGKMLLSHELVGALDYANAYQGMRSRALLLAGYDGNQHTTSTKAEGRVHIQALHVTMLGVVQPKLITKLLGQSGDGLAARLTWFYPDVVPGRRMPIGTGPVQELTELLTRLVAITPNGLPGAYPALVPLAEESRKPLEDATAEWERLRALSDVHFSDTLGRATQYALRLAFLFSVCEHAACGKEALPNQVTAANVNRAIAFVDRYVLPMAERAFGITRAPVEADAVLILKFLRRLGKPIANVRSDIMRGAGSPVRAPEKVALAMEELRQRGFVRLAPRRTQMGRPSQDWEINPILLGK
jgi:hypothetical protein